MVFVRICLYSLLIGIVSACATHYDELKYYKEGFDPNNNDFPTKGFYYTTSDTAYHVTWPDCVIELYFFKDGSFKIGATNENIETLNESICAYPKMMNKYGPFGFYTIQNDTIYVEYITTASYPQLFYQTNWHGFKAVRIDNGIRILDWNEENNVDWKFHPNACVPDSLNHWVRRHRKYRL